MTEQTEHKQETKKANWKRQTYLFGGVLGALMGFLSAYLFAQEAADESDDDERPKVPPTALLSLALSAIGLVRQIAETGQKKKERKK
jgi:gas vesicle protein